MTRKLTTGGAGVHQQEHSQRHGGSLIAAPVKVGTISARAPNTSATSQAALDIACPTVGCSLFSGSSWRYPMLGSTARAMRAMYATASMGYSPTAVSPESITADVPSRIAFA